MRAPSPPCSRCPRLAEEGAEGVRLGGQTGEGRVMAGLSDDGGGHYACGRAARLAGRRQVPRESGGRIGQVRLRGRGAGSDLFYGAVGLGAEVERTWKQCGGLEAAHGSRRERGQIFKACSIDSTWGVESGKWRRRDDVSSTAILRVVDVENRTEGRINQRVGVDVEWPARRQRGWERWWREWATIRTGRAGGGASGTYRKRGGEGTEAVRGGEGDRLWLLRSWTRDLWWSTLAAAENGRCGLGERRAVKRGRRCLPGDGPAPHGRGDVGGKWCLSFEPRAAEAETVIIILNTCRLLACPTRHHRTDRGRWRGPSSPGGSGRTAVKDE